MASMGDSYLLYTKGNVYQASNPIEVAGGSGSYTFEIADNSDPVHTLMRIIIQMILMRLLELDFAIVRQGIKPCM